MLLTLLMPLLYWFICLFSVYLVIYLFVVVALVVVSGGGTGDSFVMIFLSLSSVGR